VNELRHHGGVFRPGILPRAEDVEIAQDHRLEPVALGKRLAVVLAGESGGKAAPLADVAVKVPSGDTQHIPEAHLALGHGLVATVENALAPSSR